MQYSDYTDQQFNAIFQMYKPEPCTNCRARLSCNRKKDCPTHTKYQEQFAEARKLGVEQQAKLFARLLDIHQEIAIQEAYKRSTEAELGRLGIVYGRLNVESCRLLRAERCAEYEKAEQ